MQPKINKDAEGQGDVLAVAQHQLPWLSPDCFDIENLIENLRLIEQWPSAVSPRETRSSACPCR
jgi:hypothetical protein